MMILKTMTGQELSDVELVARSLEGNRDAFCEIVRRYQSLICSMAYSGTGSLGESEDLAQETFITAWKHLRHLRDPVRLRHWLCGIARNRINNFLRRAGREALHQAETLELNHGVAATEPLPSDQAISQEEEKILWRSLERIPEGYREPLILYYREQRSVARVAEQLELSEEAVKQRLSRGRRLLQEEVVAFVEGALARTAPGKGFAVGVLAALPVLATSASAATVVASAAKGSGVASAGAWAALLGALLGPIIGVMGGVLGIKASLANARSLEERRLILRFTWIVVGMLVVSLGVMLGFIIFGVRQFETHPVGWMTFLVSFWVGYMVLLAGLILVFNRRQHRLRSRYAQTAPDSATAGGARTAFQPSAYPPVEFRSKRVFLGLPLVHVRLGNTPESGGARAAVGWLSVGDIAVGGLFACGGIAAAPISFGGIAVGLLSLGGAVLGAAALGGFALGGLAVGGVATGYYAVGGVALAWQAAVGGMALARDVALGGMIHAPHAGDAVANAFVRDSTFFRVAQALMKSGWIWLIAWLPMALVLWQALRLRRKLADARNSSR